MTDASRPHLPVMLAEVIETLRPEDGGVYVDATFGAGGYSGAILTACDCRLIALDRDPEAAGRAEALKARFPDRFTFAAGRFGAVETLLSDVGVERVDGLVLDIGVSSMQLDRAERGFSFRASGPLDMRMSKSGPSAADLVNEMDETDLANLIYRLGEERMSRKIARAIVAKRAEEPITDTVTLAEVIRGVCRKSPDGIDPATRTFQALRIAVNDELGELERALDASSRVLRPGGRLVVVTFHSLEDRIVKTFLRENSGGSPGSSRHLPGALAPTVAEREASFRLPERRPRFPGEEELRRNPRARSARLRFGVRTNAPSAEQSSPVQSLPDPKERRR